VTVLRYTVPGAPVSTNQGYRGAVIKTRHGMQHRLVLKPEGKAFKDWLQACARVAWMKAGRPSALERAQVVARLVFPTLGSDIDGPVKFLLDSLQAAGLVVNDTRIRRLVLEKMDPDGSPRIEVAVGPTGGCCPTCGCTCGGLR
jgi:hypothetical protein